MPDDPMNELETHEGLWIQESERRLDELESGVIEPVPAEQVIESARSALR